MLRSALGARSLASSLKSGEVGALKIALTHSVDLSLLIPHLDQIKRLFSRLEFRLLRGSSREVGEFLKTGDAELGIAAAIDDDWDRLDSWPLFTESFQLAVSNRHRLATRDSVCFDDLTNEQLLSRNYCECSERLNASFRENGVGVDHRHEVSSERDLIELIEADFGIALVPRSAMMPKTLHRTPVDGLDLRRTVHLYGVAGRERTVVASAVLRMLRGASWPHLVGETAAL